MVQNILARRAWISVVGAAAAAVALGSKNAMAQVSATRFQPAQHPQDEWLDKMPGKHRTVIDSATVHGGGEAILYANNLFVANGSGYGLTDGDVAVVVVLRHFSTVFAYNDVIWAKYGKALSDAVQFTDPKSRQAPTTNLYNATGYGQTLPTLGNTIAGVARRGTHFAVCEMATRLYAGVLAGAVGGTPDAVFKELTSNLVPNSHMMAAGVVAVNRAQEYGYTLLSAG